MPSNAVARRLCVTRGVPVCAMLAEAEADQREDWLDAFVDECWDEPDDDHLYYPLYDEDEFDPYLDEPYDPYDWDDYYEFP